MNERVRELLNKGYSPQVIAMTHGGPVGTREYYDLLNQLEPDRTIGCPYCGELCFGTGDCNCQDK